MKFLRYVLILLISPVLIIGCNADGDLLSDDSLKLGSDSAVNEFVWFGMNQFYFWQSEVSDLSDGLKDSVSQLSNFLNNYDTPEELFDELLHPDDRFSWIVDDFEVLEASFQGISKSFGYELRILRRANNSNDLFAYVEYVVPSGPADNAGVVRGDIFTQVNNTQLTIENYLTLLFQNEAYDIQLAEFVDGTFVPTEKNIRLVAEDLSENPIHLAKILPTTHGSVGYLMYNQFVSNNAYHEELNEIFGDFKNKGITDLVLDLRYNGGGSLTTSRILASMIYGGASDNDVLGSIIYNEKLSANNTEIPFITSVPVFNGNGGLSSSVPMNRLNLNRVFVLISGSSASASEFVIAGLQPFMDVILIGTRSVGKNVASITLYDSNDFEKSETLNPNHKYAIQPIISQLANSVGFTDYIDGFVPDIEVDELDYLGDLKPLGDPSEPLLAEALAVISGVVRKGDKSSITHEFIFFDDSNLRNENANVILIDDELISSDLIRKIANNE